MASAIGSGKTWPEQLFQDFDAVERLPVTTEGDLDMELMVALQK
jgi:hypothetical protein